MRTARPTDAIIISYRMPSSSSPGACPRLEDKRFDTDVRISGDMCIQTGMKARIVNNCCCDFALVLGAVPRLESKRLFVSRGLRSHALAGRKQFFTQGDLSC